MKAAAAAPARLDSEPVPRTLPGPRPAPSTEPADRPQLARLMRLTVPVLVRIAERAFPAGTIMKLAPGAIIEFEKSGDAELDLMINNAVIGRGMAVRLNEHFGLRVTAIRDISQRIRSMDGKAPTST